MSDFIHDTVTHTKQTWTDVVHCKATKAEYVEAGVEIAAAAAAAYFGLSKLLPAAQQNIFAEEKEMLSLSARLKAAGRGARPGLHFDAEPFIADNPELRQALKAAGRHMEPLPKIIAAPADPSVLTDLKLVNSRGTWVTIGTLPKKIAASEDPSVLTDVKLVNSRGTWVTVP